MTDRKRPKKAKSLPPEAGPDPVTDSHGGPEPGVRVQKPGRNRSEIIGLISAVVLILMLPVVIFAIGLYVFEWDDPVTDKVIQIIPYPAATVDFSLVPFNEFRQDTDKLTFYYQKQGEALGESVETLESSVIRSRVLNRLIEEEIINQEAKKRGIKVAQSELDQEYKKIIEQAESSDKVESTLGNYYNYTPKEFNEKVLRPFLVRRKLDQALKKDASSRDQARSRADEAWARLQAQEDDFSDLAQEYSDDFSSLKGGDTGYVSVSDFPPELQNEIKSLKSGDWTKVVESEDGFHIFQLMERVPGSGEEITVKGSYIFIAPDGIDEWLEQKTGQVMIWRFVS